MVIPRIFYVTSTTLAVFHCEKGGIELLAKFEDAAASVAAFGKYVAQQSDVPSAMVVDVVEEEFRTEHIPHVIGTDRKHLLARKTSAMFRQTPFRNAQIIKREKRGRKDDLVLFSALTRPQIMEPWLAKLRSNKVPLVGIYSMAMLAQLLVKRLNIEHSNMEVLSIQQGELLRQSFVNDRALKSSRLAYLDTESDASCLKSILSEVERNHQYLGRLQLLKIGEPVVVYLLSEGEQLEYLHAGCVDSDRFKFNLLDLNDVAAKIGLDQTLSADQSELFFCYLLSRWLPEGNYGAGIERRYYKQYRLRNQLKVASVLLAMVSCGWSVSHVLDGYALSQTTADLSEHIEMLALDYKRQAAALPDLNYSPKVIRAAVVNDQALQARKPSALGALAIVGSVLLKHKNVAVDELSWGVEVMVDDFGEETQVDVAKIKAHLEQFPQDFQRAFQQVDAFTKDLNQNPLVQNVEALSLPLSTSPKSSLTGESQRIGLVPVAKFELKIRLKPREHSPTDSQVDDGGSSGNS
ncbi:hypothetical protein ACFL2V_20935 [Pseudomonadota bacterium]